MEKDIYTIGDLVKELKRYPDRMRVDFHEYDGGHVGTKVIIVHLYPPQ